MKDYDYSNPPTKAVDSNNKSNKANSTVATLGSNFLPKDLGDSLQLPPSEDYNLKSVPATALPSIDEETFYNSIEERFNPDCCRMATVADVAGLNPRLEIYDDEKDIYMYCHPAEVYFAKDLRHREHAFNTITPPPNPRASNKAVTTVPICAPRHVQDDFTVFRSQHSLWQKHFLHLQLCLPTIAKFVLEHGYGNNMRDGQQSRKCRVDIGCAGEDNVQLPNGEWEPAATYGMNVFDGVENAESIKQQIADVFDALQRCMDEIEQVEFKKDLPYNFPPRRDKFSKHLMDALKAVWLRFENLSIQVKCVSVGDRTGRHGDGRNCVWVRYDKTGALCFMFVDAYGYVWSIKFIANSRARIGEYFDKKLSLESMQTRIQRHLQNVDQSLKMCFAKQHYFAEREEENLQDRLCCGCVAPTHLTFQKLHLNEDSPWETTNIGGAVGEVQEEVMKSPSNIVRDFFLSPAVDVLHKYSKRGMEETRIIELGIMVGFQNGFLRYHVVGRDFEEDIFGSPTPSVAMFHAFISKFGSITGDPTQRRLNPSGINYEAVMLDDTGKPNFVMDFMVQEVTKLLHKINEIVQQESFSQVTVEEAFRATCSTWAEYHVDINEFRLMLIVQVLILAQVIVKPHQNLKNIVYPVSGLGAAAQLKHVPPEERHTVLTWIQQHCKVEEFGLNAVECILCETSLTRVGVIFDYYIKGQSLFTLDKRGQAMVKRYGTTDWRPVSEEQG